MYYLQRNPTSPRDDRLLANALDQVQGAEVGFFDVF